MGRGMMSSWLLGGWFSPSMCEFRGPGPAAYSMVADSQRRFVAVHLVVLVASPAVSQEGFLASDRGSRFYSLPIDRQQLHGAHHWITVLPAWLGIRKRQDMSELIGRTDYCSVFFSRRTDLLRR